ncbi:MAG: undecaprenyldiphospho-muramoylpentapeptide beta-N-acetylglucosaminyltransferase [Candidatus Nitrohelix vancouverensis]|uniref:UDP-N-acetylglucosamine--N-acetylmuramyl-(pentapeptide) pyrophosphoryl-undecaprenol N-acetylglucosamine transferase n=1 Tax=Candidatus Nitrohelix vancouverensis TaxID=2705534 RepID=A0A7T0C4U3_9BACT|nr:MAG: undecaprenyldiphospho-muramoylpentapeptide beta-N-acetylglucosaminyltransferase [Candidatus Nitrohelix vancouverensis]
MPTRVVIAGGGTGGHLFPAIALARELEKSVMDIEISFVGSKQGLESKIIPREGWNLKTIFTAGLMGKKGLNRWVSLSKLPVGILQSVCFLVQKKPDLVVGVGGYASGPLALSAWMLKIPILIHEQNSIPGMTNRWLGKIADKVAVSFKDSERHFPAGKVVETGNMIREEFCVPREQATQKRTDKFCIFVMGGSQGAHSINAAMMEALESLLEEKDRIHIIHQTGTADFQAVKQSYDDFGFSADVRPFFENIEKPYREASLVISRAGATTLAEVTACGKVSILIPFPYAAHNHQEKNARILESANAAEMILDQELTGQQLAQSIQRALSDEQRLETMEANSYRLGNREATKNVRDLCLELMKTTQNQMRNDNASKRHELSCF